MATGLTLRETKGSKLTIEEMDGNLTYLQSLVQTDIKRYKALVSQSGTDVPTAVVLENTLGGDVTFIRPQAGSYRINSASLFGSSKDKCAVSLGSTKKPGFTGGAATFLFTKFSTASEIQFFQTLVDYATLAEGNLDNVLLTIEVYP